MRRFAAFPPGLRRRAFAAAFVLAAAQAARFPAAANPWNGQVVLQGFWWNYWNTNYPGDWASYLSCLAPRLRALGVDMVWLPPTSKNQDSIQSVGYSPFDPYDLGDKYQGGATGTRYGRKDALLRSVAVFHANGLGVMQDVIYSHLAGAGSRTGAGGADPTSWGADSYKNFRYVCWSTPAGSDSAADYLSRRGRLPKNWGNFHPNPAHPSDNTAETREFFGPSVCYAEGAFGRSSNAAFDPVQTTGWMLNGMRAWSVWLKKQTGVDAFRIDSAKNTEVSPVKDFIWNMAYNAGFASGGAEMVAVGEFVDGGAAEDSWVDAVNNDHGFTDVVGTFDFGLRGALLAMVQGRGAFDLSTLPGAQQQRRRRTVPFVNDHDTFRPVLDASGRYAGWDSAHELGGHIDPDDPRAQAAYAVAFAVDGSPCVFFEDLFDLNSTGKRFTHLPNSPADLPVRDYLANLIWCHGMLDFKAGSPRVRWAAPDLLIIERAGRALIGVNDQDSRWQSATVATSFGANVRLHDYSGANEQDVVTDGAGRVALAVPPCDGGNRRRGYSVWGPAGIGGAFSPPGRSTVQEWELADDLGDSHPLSLRQGGALPQGSVQPRVAGRIFAAAGRAAAVFLYQELPSQTAVLRLRDGRSRILAAATNSGVVTVTWTPEASDWITLEAAQGNPTNASQRAWIQAHYAAPAEFFVLGPSATIRPPGAAVLAGEPVVLSANATGSPPLDYQWRFNGGVVAGATNAVLEISEAGFGDAGAYSVQVSNTEGSVESAAVNLSVEPLPVLAVSVVGATEPRGFSVSVSGSPLVSLRLEASEDLAGWAPLTTNRPPFSHALGWGASTLFLRAAPVR